MDRILPDGIALFGEENIWREVLWSVILEVW